MPTRPRRASRRQKANIFDAAGSGTGFTCFLTNDLVPTSFVQPFVDNQILRVLYTVA